MKILFVCHGNICRSPMAEFVMKDLVKQQGMSDLFTIASAATHNDELGNAVHTGTRRVLASHGISCEGKVARRLRASDADAWDIIVGMDEANMLDIRNQLGGSVRGKTHKLLEFAGSSRDVADPWYTGDFETTYDDVYAGCSALLMQIEADRSTLRRFQ